MDRNQNLEIALDTWTKLPVKEIIIVDWSSKKPLDYLLKKDKRIKIVRVDGKKYYHHSAANNLKIKYAETDYILALDADIKVVGNIFEMHDLEENVLQRGYGNIKKGIFGVYIVQKKWFDLVGGYNEKMCYGWGYEDNDLYERLKRKGLVVKKIIGNMFKHIKHDNDLRAKNTKIKNIEESKLKNIEISEKYEWTNEYKKQEHYEKIII